jgi:hypothetical protein
MINKLISGIVEHFSSELTDTNKIDLILKPIMNILYNKYQIYINAGISLYFILLFISILNLIIILIKY